MTGIEHKGLAIQIEPHLRCLRCVLARGTEKRELCSRDCM